jgi:hypothetical protein
MSALRTRFVQDMQLHGFSPKTQACYVGAVRGLAKFYGQSPDLVSEEETAQLVPASDAGKKSRPGHGHHCPVRPQVLFPEHRPARLDFPQAAAPAPLKEAARRAQPPGSQSHPGSGAEAHLSGLPDDDLRLAVCVSMKAAF